jgi:hypothetical protein
VPSTSGSYGIGTFTITKQCNLKGNCMSLLYGDNASDQTSVPSYSFHSLFIGCTTIKEVSRNFLPATTIATHCYDSMFEGCTSLITAPELPATTLASYCYYYMFYGCTSLTTAPNLYAKTLVKYCYAYMFNGCSKLNYIKATFTTSPSTSASYR